MTMRRVFVSLALTAALAGCASGGPVRAAGPTTTTAPEWQPPVAGVYVPVSDIPAPTAPEVGIRGMWRAAAQACREYDAARWEGDGLTCAAADSALWYARGARNFMRALQQNASVRRQST